MPHLPYLPHPEKTLMTFASHRSAPWTWRTSALSATLCLAMFSVHLQTLAAPLTAGSALPTLSLKDQHDKPVAIASDTRWVLFSGEKSVSDMVGTVLSAEPAGVMGRLHLIYVADISSMPALVTRMFALPKLRDLPYSIALVREAAERAQVADLPRPPGAATLLRLENGRIVQISAVPSAADLRTKLGLAPAQTAP